MKAVEVKGFRSIGVALLVSAATSGNVLAAPGAALGAGYMLTEEDFYGEIPKVISAARFAQPINEAPAATTVIDRRMIEASGARNLVDVFRLVPGFLVGYWAGNEQMAMYQGLGAYYSRQIQVMIDGRAMYMPSLGGAPWAELPLVLSDIKRIEVTRGPNAVSYGSNSFFAVINIITEKAADANALRLTSRRGSGNERDFEISEAVTTGKFGIKVTAARQYDEGFDAFNDTRDMTNLNFRSDYQEQDGDRWSVYLGQAVATQGRGDFVSAVDSPRDAGTRADYQHLRWESEPGRFGAWAFQVYRTSHSLEDTYTTNPLPGLPAGVFLDQSYASRRYDVELQNTMAPADWLTVVWGGSLRRDRTDTDTYLGSNNPEEIAINRIFFNTEWRAVDPLLVHVGVMREDHEYTGVDYQPRVALSYTPYDGHTFRVSRSKATRTPTAFEQKADTYFCLEPTCTFFDRAYYSDGNLKPEKIDSTEAGYVGKLLPHTIFDIRRYYNKVRDIITDHKVATVDAVDNFMYEYDNIHNIDIQGTEVQLTYKDGGNRFILAYARNHVSADGWYNNDRIEESFPEQIGSAMWARQFSDGYSAAATWSYTDKLRHRDGDKNRVTGELYGPTRRLDLQLAKSVKAGTLNIKLVGGVKNVFDDYVEYRSENVVGTTYYFSLSGSLY